MSVPLSNPKHERFCQLVAAGANAAEAYKEALQTQAKSARVNASQLLTKEAISLRVEGLRAEYAAHVAQKEAEAAAKAEEFKQSIFATKDEILRMMTDTLRAKPSDAALDNPLCDLRMSKAGPYPAFIDKTAAAERICKMMGWDAKTEAVNVAVAVSVLPQSRAQELAAKKRSAAENRLMAKN